MIDVNKPITVEEKDKVIADFITKEFEEAVKKGFMEKTFDPVTKTDKYHFTQKGINQIKRAKQVFGVD